jgi:hypothetical protein
VNDEWHETEASLQFMKLHSPAAVCLSARGATMLAVLMFVMTTSIIITASVSLMGARSQQAERHGDAVQRHVAMGNTRAVNQQFTFTWGLRESLTRLLGSISLGSWGGITAEVLNLLSPFQSTARPSSVTDGTYPFNNIRNTPTPDNGVFFERTVVDADGSLGDPVTFYNYFKTYPSSLLGDLLVLHKRPSSATGSYVAGNNIRVNGTVVIWDPTVDASGVRAQSCLNLTKTGTNSTQDTSASPSMPANFPAPVRTTAASGAAASATAVSDGSLNLANNPEFPAGSIRHKIESSGIQGVAWATCGTALLSNIRTDFSSGDSTSATQVRLESTPTYAPPSTSPFNYTASGSLNVLYVRLKNSGLRHLRITGGVEQLVLQGQTTTTDYTAAAALPPLMIWLEQSSCRDIRFVGENSRRLILATGPGTGSTIFCSWHGTSLVGGSPLRWRLHWINEYRSLYLNSPTGNGVLLTGGIRTNWTMDFTDTTNAIRFTLQRETDPGVLQTLLPRDGWMEAYTLVR